MSHTLHASCLCGVVRWEIDGPLRAPDPDRDPLAVLFMSHCHCGRCRKAHGAPYATYVTVPEGRLRVTHGRERIVRWPSSTAMFRPFCSTCGSVVPDGTAWNGVVGTPAGSFEEELGVTPTSHIFVASKAPWVDLTDDLPRFDAYPDALGMQPMETRAPVDPAARVASGGVLSRREPGDGHRQLRDGPRRCAGELAKG